ncbi:complex I subunit 5 family protein [Azohydromonas aeria]|uniref:complex I subunit 5 family protein n=1 Tax=Azohydromonas aeria TaxID=2590212 RepID=UPI0012FA99B1|nr:proton-conducting transporter membrane subunit [Azohydromonas aeria]
MRGAEAAVLLVFVPLVAAGLAVALPRRARAWAVLGALLAQPLLLLVLSAETLSQGPRQLVLAGQAVPLGIRLYVDGLALLMLWLVAAVGGVAGVHALASHPPASAAGGRFWPLWLLMTAGLQALFLSGDLFNVYVAIELLTLCAIALVAAEGEPGALRAAMRYLLLGMLASLAYLLGVALLYGEHGTLDLAALAAPVAAAGRRGVTLPALALISVGLLLKAAVFPLHVWLPPAHAQAPGAVSAVLSALVVKTGIYMLYRLWLWTGEGLQRDAVLALLGTLGAAAVLFGSAAALVQDQLKRVVAYSTVAQLGYLMLAFPLLGAAAASPAWAGAGLQLAAHGVAKAAMFLAAAALVHGLGSGRLERLAGADRTLPLGVFAFGLAGVSLMGLPPSGGFLAKWLLLQAAWGQGAWAIVAVLLAGSLMAAGYVFRVLAAAFARDEGGPPAAVRPVPLAMTLPALLLGVCAVAMGFAAAPLLRLLGVAPPGGEGAVAGLEVLP